MAHSQMLGADAHLSENLEIPTVGFGIVSLVFGGFLFTTQMVQAKMLNKEGWPYIRLVGASCVLMVIQLIIFIKVKNIPWPNRDKWKWIVLRGIFGATNFILSVLAVWLSPIGDVASLTSCNVVMAALLGRCFLGESLNRYHITGLSCSIMGAVLVTRPGFLFGTSSASGFVLVGYVLSILAGFCQACIFITVRKAGEGVSTWVSSLSSFASHAIVLIVIPFTPLLYDNSVAPVTNEPWMALGWFTIIHVNSFGRVFLLSMGSKWCPAAVTSTVNTATCMIGGYAVQTLLFHEVPEPLSLLGAGLMLLSITLMACNRTQTAGTDQSRRRPSKIATVNPLSSNTNEVEAVEKTVSNVSTEVEDNDQVEESLMDFIASEFVYSDPYEAATTVVQISVRQRNQKNAQAGETIGKTLYPAVPISSS
eukprot:gnl/MRDRNA2_/MRDRNA2_17599_c0_seq1.p1 gnl/MRDRNA2_/MRDRNA2_17599_c0~~gnl/MRDRNA2_/MRDRNA2_17599_c0_seq1.p1  ORF type:complete len:422 (+),score=32.00 gnl/MRDRNA2_/MRDRNA2_17599_c0_seq1:98-1363(+)